MVAKLPLLRVVIGGGGGVGVVVGVGVGVVVGGVGGVVIVTAGAVVGVAFSDVGQGLAAAVMILSQKLSSTGAGGGDFFYL